MNTPVKNLSLASDDPTLALRVDLPKPDFLLLGGAKCGTTSFAAYLPAHPQVAPWVVKEPNYWSWRKPTAEQYQALFSNSEPLAEPGPSDQIAGDYSTSSIIHPMVPRRVRASLPKVKLIVMLRNPIDRAYSHFIMSQRSGLEKEQSFDAIVRKEIEQVPDLLAAHRNGFEDPAGTIESCCQDKAGKPLSFSVHNQNWTQRPLKLDIDLQAFYYTSYVFRSIYCDQVERWLTLYPREQLLVIQSEKFFRDPARYMSVSAEFLGLQAHNFSADNELLRHYGGSASGDWAPPEKYPPMSKATRKLLSNFFIPYNEKLFRLIGEKYRWK
jgi:Sulfotransferase domain